ncbi:peptidoglycan recognition protein family protein [Nonomuraea bangladeshensis]|uniref:peptidoglycan recognition protein family protein n=1 Tax=Nonomuraea bangladeshensis TaxID=404385 RepID=UPI003C2D8694
MADLVTRSGWGAKAPSQALTRIASTRGVKVHYTGGHVSPAIVDDHTRCIALVRSIQRMHMAGGREQPYSDIGYSMVACPHRKVFVGRGPHILPAANGPGQNAGHYAVLALVGSSGFTEPTDELLHAIVDAIEHLRAHGSAGAEIKCHRDGYPTDCPGGPLTAWVRRGAPRPGAAKPAKARLPELKPGDTSPHVVTLRKKLGAANQTSKVYDPTDPDLAALIEAFKARHKLGSGPVWSAACWDALNRSENP